MKIPFSARLNSAAVFAASLFCIVAPSVELLGQGALTPPGAPTPIFKTLSQIEPRTPLNTLPGDSTDVFIISQPGSYYLTTNIYFGTTNGIRVLTNDVDIDLGGFTMYGPVGQTAMHSFGPNVSRVRIHNGHLAGWGNGILFYANGQATNCVFEDLQISLSGTPFASGISCGEGARFLRCSISDATGSSSVAIQAADRCVIEHCSIFNCYAGINAGSFSIIKDCLVKRCTGDSGILGVNSCIIQNNLVDGCKSGMTFYNSCTISDNSCQNSTAGSGFNISGNFSRVESNLSISNSGAGFISQGDTTNNIVVRNVARGNNNGNFSLNPTDTFGPSITASGVIVTNNPWANFSY